MFHNDTNKLFRIIYIPLADMSNIGLYHQPFSYYLQND